MHERNEPLFTCLFIYTHFGCLSLELNRVPGVLLEPYMSQGGQGSAELPMVLKGLTMNTLNVRLLYRPEKCGETFDNCVLKDLAITNFTATCSIKKASQVKEMYGKIPALTLT